MRHVRRLAALVGASVALAACGGAHGDEPRELSVLAAASLTDVVGEVAALLEERTPGLDVVVTTAGSQQLAAQLLGGARADVFVSADPLQMERVVTAGLVAGTPTTFATNELAIAVEPGNPRRVQELADLAAPDLVVVLAAAAVPVGRYTRRALEREGVRVTAASQELDARAVRARVASGEADAGIVFATDVAAADGAVDGVPVTGSAAVRAAHPVAALAGGPNPTDAEAFVTILTGDEGRAVLAAAGYGPP